MNDERTEVRIQPTREEMVHEEILSTVQSFVRAIGHDEAVELLAQLSTVHERLFPETSMDPADYHFMRTGMQIGKIEHTLKEALFGKDIQSRTDVTFDTEIPDEPEQEQKALINNRISDMIQPLVQEMGRRKAKKLLTYISILTQGLWDSVTVSGPDREADRQIRITVIEAGRIEIGLERALKLRHTNFSHNDVLRWQSAWQKAHRPPKK